MNWNWWKNTKIYSVLAACKSRCFARKKRDVEDVHKESDKKESTKKESKMKEWWNNSALVIHTKALRNLREDGWKCFVRWFHSHLPKRDVEFLSLTPTDQAEYIDTYSEALSQALLNEHIHNIAITGAYGSGKTSFLRTYFKEHPNFWPYGGKKNKCITISLANLADKSKQKGEITLQEIEVSILHQLFFHEQSGALTDSHFTKIQKIGFWKLSRYTIYVLVFLISCVHIIWPRLMTRLIGLPNIAFLKEHNWWHWFCVAGALAGILWFVYHLIRVIAQVAVRKLSVNSASIEIYNKQEKSILNEHIDEIIYFFSVTGYNIVLIEDLDRFKQQSIFVKLREINHLINNSKEVKQRVRFIYALSDYMFKDESRTKFFDFIIPIIPVVDASNSGEMLRKYLAKEEHLVGVVDAIAMYVRDARLLNNIINEFYIYRNRQLKQSQDGDRQIFALIVYKNLFPDDFEELRIRDRGRLANALHEKKQLIAERQPKIDSEIESVRAQIDDAQTEQLRNEKELRQLFVVYVMREAMARFKGNLTDLRVVTQNGTRISVGKLEDDANFNAILQAPLFYIATPTGGMQGNYQVSAVLSKVYGEFSYAERVRRITERAGIEEKNERLRKLTEERISLRQQSLQALLQSARPKSEKAIAQKEGESETQYKQRLLIDAMLRAGYITEDYADYISLFHDGSLTPSDYMFIRNVRAHESMSPKEPLKNPREVIKKLDICWFSQIQILNYTLMDALLEFFPDDDKCNSVISLLKQYTQESITFIADYAYEGNQSGKLIKRLCADKANLFWEVINRSRLNEDVKQYLLQTMIAYGEEDDIVTNLKDSVGYVSSLSQYFTWPIDGERLRNVAKRLDLHFTALDEKTDANSVMFVYGNNLFAITKDMMERVLPKELTDDERYHTSNYSYLWNEAPKSLVEYLESNKEKYVRNVLLEMPTNTHEKSLHESALLSSEDLSLDLKEKLVEQGQEKWDAIDQWDEQTHEVQLMLYKYKRVQVTWENVMYLFGLDEQAFNEYIQYEDVLGALKAIGKPDLGEETREKWQAMQNAIVANPNLETVAEQLLDCFDVAFEQVTIMNCSERLLRLLVEKGLIARGVSEYEVLHGINPDFALEFFVMYFDNYKAIISDLKFNEYDIEMLFRNDYNLSNEQKLHILENIDAEKSVTEYNAFELITFLMQQEINADMENEGIFNAIDILLCLANVPTITRMILFNKYPIYEGRDKEELDNMISTFDTTYLTDGRLKHQIPYSREAYAFGRYLMKIGYIKNCVKFVNRGIISITKK